ncbi:hypothetical protein D9613_004741 [Agrocybe pediades]|uniref:Uncharacterized protein n=1 Tax=Agrocybe pediades TaxID=84607 RepID=A0A8H4QZ52_9AGAR|nr:hypothetical protein D9613_004741 [Agrocybe pediades]
MSASLIKYKGLADILVAVILIFEPSLIYESVVAKQLHIWSGLHLSDASTAPGFNHSLACMVAAVGVAHVVAARSGAGPEAWSIICASSA